MQAPAGRAHFEAVQGHAGGAEGGRDNSHTVVVGPVQCAVELCRRPGGRAGVRGVGVGLGPGARLQREQGPSGAVKGCLPCKPGCPVPLPQLLLL